MAIDNQRVLLIRNSNVAVAEVSESVSDWYAGARGLCGAAGSADYFWLSFDFGNGSYVDTVAGRVQHPSHTGPIIDGPTPDIHCTGQSSKIAINHVGQTVIQSITSVIATYKIQVLLVLPGVPRDVYIGGSVGTGGEYGQYIELVLAELRAYSDGINFGDTLKSPGKIRTSNLGRLITDGSGSGTSRTGQLRQLTDIFDLCKYHSILSGRVGWVDRFVSADNCSSLAEVQTIVNNAKAAELVDPYSKLHVLGGTAYIYSGGVLSSTAVNYLGRDVGLRNLSYIADGIAGPGYAEEALWITKPPWAGSALAQMVNGGLNGQQSIQAYGGGMITPFCLVSPILLPGYPDPYYQARLSFAPGGFGYGWASAASLLSDFILKTGGSMGFGSGGEPFADNLVDSDSLLYLLMQGLTGAEACYKAGQYWEYTGPSVRDLPSGSTFLGTAKWTSVQGDPLYAPYKANSLYTGKSMQVGQ